MPIIAAVAVPHPPLIIPKIGRGQETVIQNTIDSYMEAMEFIANNNPETIVIISPHAGFYYDRFQISPGKCSTGSFSMFGYPEIEFAALYDKDVAEKIFTEAEASGLRASLERERTCPRSWDNDTSIFFREVL